MEKSKKLIEKWIKGAFEKRQILEKQNPSLFQNVTEILFKHDPIGINYEVNDNEYEPEAGTIIPKLKDCKNYMDTRKVIYQEFLNWFYDDIGTEEEYTEIAKEIWDVWIAFGEKI